MCEGARWPYDALEADGKTPTYGGYSNKIVVDENYTLQIPNNLPLDRSAPLLYAVITLYSPLVHWKVGSGKKVAIVGLGGLGHKGVKIAHALGAEVTVLSHSFEKKTARYWEPINSILRQIRPLSRTFEDISMSSSIPFQQFLTSINT